MLYVGWHDMRLCKFIRTFGSSRFGMAIDWVTSQLATAARRRLYRGRVLCQRVDVRQSTRDVLRRTRQTVSPLIDRIHSQCFDFYKNRPAFWNSTRWSINDSVDASFIIAILQVSRVYEWKYGRLFRKL